MGAAAILGGTGIATAGGDDSESDDENDNGNGDEGNVASLKGFHASPDAPNVDVYVNDVLVLEDVAFGEVSDYLVLLSGEYDVAGVPTGADTQAAGGTPLVAVPAGGATPAGGGGGSCGQKGVGGGGPPPPGPPPPPPGGPPPAGTSTDWSITAASVSSPVGTTVTSYSPDSRTR